METVTQYGRKITALTAKLFSDPETTRGVSYLAMGVFDAREQLGHPLAGYETIRSTLKIVADVIGSTKLIQRFDLFLTGDAFWTNVDPKKALWNVARLCSRVAYLVYDFFGLVNVLEKFAVISKGIGNSVSQKTFGAPLETTRSFFGFLACAFALVDVAQFAIRRPETKPGVKGEGFTLATALEAGTNIGRMVSFAAGRTLVGSLALVASCLCSVTRFGIKNW